MIILDFDGVLFDSASEAYEVCQKVAYSYTGYRQDIGYSEFLNFRKYITDAWQFNRLYSQNHSIEDYTTLDKILASGNDIEFATVFFKAREEMMVSENWAKVMLPYKFFTEIKVDLNSNSDYFKILSTRNQDSIYRTLKFNGVSDIQIAGQEYIRDMGSKAAVVKNLGWGKSRNNLTMYIDDMPKHLEGMSGLVDVLLQAEWGYGEHNNKSVSQELCIDLVKAFIKNICK